MVELMAERQYRSHCSPRYSNPDNRYGFEKATRRDQRKNDGGNGTAHAVRTSATQTVARSTSRQRDTLTAEALKQTEQPGCGKQRQREAPHPP